jgi:menaquinol-cytochrome c reductase cytochrome b subunit
VLLESLIFAAAIYVGYFVWAIVSGYVLTRYYVPDIINAYASVDYLQQRVSFGGVVRISPVYKVAGFVLLSAVYCIVRIGLSNLLYRRRSGG